MNKLKIQTISAHYSLFGVTRIFFAGVCLVAFSAHSQVEINEDAIKVPGGIVIDQEGVQVPGVTIKKDGTAGADNKESASKNSANLRYTGNHMMGADLSGQDLSGLVVQSSDFRKVNFSGSNLQKARLQSSDFRGADFSKAMAVGARLQSSDFRNANFQGMDLRGARLQSSDFRGASFRGACLIGARLQVSHFGGADFTDAIIVDVDFSGSDLSSAQLNDAIRFGVDDCPSQLEERPQLTDAENIEKRLTVGVDARIDLTVNFAYDSDKIEGPAHAQIVEIAKALRSNALSDSRILIEGHTDSEGDNAYNLDLSYRRALAVMMTLSRNHDVSPNRLSIKGFGEDQPIATNATADGRALNRRVTLVNQGT